MPRSAGGVLSPNQLVRLSRAATIWAPFVSGLLLGVEMNSWSAAVMVADFVNVSWPPLLRSEMLPPASMSVTVGVLVYPAPGFVIVNPVTTPPAIMASAAAPLPPPPVNCTVGATVYPLPALVIVNPVSLLAVIVAVAVAFPSTLPAYRRPSTLISALVISAVTVILP